MSKKAATPSFNISVVRGVRDPRRKSRPFMLRTNIINWKLPAPNLNKLIRMTSTRRISVFIPKLYKDRFFDHGRFAVYSFDKADKHTSRRRGFESEREGEDCAKDKLRMTDLAIKSVYWETYKYVSERVVEKRFVDRHLPRISRIISTMVNVICASKILSMKTEVQSTRVACPTWYDMTSLVLEWKAISLSTTRIFGCRVLLHLSH